MRMPGEVVIDMGKAAPLVDDGSIVVDRDGRGPLRDIFQTLADLGERRSGLGNLVMIQAGGHTQLESFDEFWRVEQLDLAAVYFRIAGIGREAVAAARQIDTLLHSRPVDIISGCIDGETV